MWAVVKEVKEVKVERCDVFDNNRNLSWHPDRIRQQWELCLSRCRGENKNSNKNALEILALLWLFAVRVACTLPS